MMSHGKDRPVRACTCGDWHDLGELIEKLQVENDEMREVLGTLEWVARDNFTGQVVCPVCLNRPRKGHVPGCKLATLKGATP